MTRGQGPWHKIQCARRIQSTPTHDTTFLRELIYKGEFVITHVDSEQQRADFLTTPLNNTVSRYHRDFLMNVDAFSPGQTVLYFI